MKSLLSELSIFFSLGKSHFLATQRDHPPADVFAKPDLVGARHGKTLSVQETGSTQADQKGPRIRHENRVAAVVVAMCVTGSSHRLSRAWYGV
jgi:hypothetical protein